MPISACLDISSNRWPRAVVIIVVFVFALGLLGAGLDGATVAAVLTAIALVVNAIARLGGARGTVSP
jgi:hypothetical protein